MIDTVHLSISAVQDQENKDLLGQCLQYTFLPLDATRSYLGDLWINNYWKRNTKLERYNHHNQIFKVYPFIKNVLNQHYIMQRNKIPWTGWCCKGSLCCFVFPPHLTGLQGVVSVEVASVPFQKEANLFFKIKNRRVKSEAAVKVNASDWHWEDSSLSL